MVGIGDGGHRDGGFELTGDAVAEDVAVDLAGRDRLHSVVGPVAELGQFVVVADD